MTNTLSMRSVVSEDAKWIEEFMNKNWGGLPLVIRGKKYDPRNLEGFIIENTQGIAGFLFYEIQHQDCEIIGLEAFEKFKGIGTMMLNNLKEMAKNKNCRRIYLMTTNDNLDALRFYQGRGFFICNIHVDSVKISRKIKPSIGMVGDYGISVRDEIDLEFLL